MPLTTKQLIRSLMLAENLGDVHDIINELCKDQGLPQPEGDFLQGWTNKDLYEIGAPRR